MLFSVHHTSEVSKPPGKAQTTGPGLRENAVQRRGQRPAYKKSPESNTGHRCFGARLCTMDVSENKGYQGLGHSEEASGGMHRAWAGCRDVEG